MRFLYNISILLYGSSVRLASLFSEKAKQWSTGRTDILQRIEKALSEKDPERKRPRAWFHCASLGEFEQGRPVIEAYRQKHPDHLIILTFFSPSGYEIRKNYPGADLVFYLPVDTPSNAKSFISAVDPETAVFVKYEYWFNYLSELRKRKKKVVFISVIMRPSQIFFRPWGKWFRKQLSSVSWFFVQNDASLKLLNSAGFENVTVSGDTRFDRVAEISRNSREIPFIRTFCGSSNVIIGGSTWPDDEKILIPYINNNKVKGIIAPHETKPERIREIISQIRKPVLKYSELTEEKAATADVVVIDSIGMLSSLYHYANVAYIGGGFGVGIHNILEAAAWGIPVVFGPNHKRFREAVDLLELGGAFTVNSGEQLVRILDNLLQNFSDGGICSEYVTGNQGATLRIMEFL